MAAPPLLIATRGSALALAQANAVLAQCQAAAPDQAFQLKIIQTTGDKLLSAALAGGQLPKGLFTKELEAALLSRQADLAVHSLKDLPTELPPGLKLAAVTARAEVRDVLVYRQGELRWPGVHPQAADVRPGRPTSASAQQLTSSQPERSAPSASATSEAKPLQSSLAALSPQAVVGTSSTRRAAQLRHHRPDLRIVPLRGNVGTRLRKLSQQRELDAIILAGAGLARLGCTVGPDGLLQGPDVPAGLAAVPVPVEELLPAVGQGALGIEIRANEPPLDRLCATLNHLDTWRCVTAERAFLQAMGGGCHLAVAAYATVEGGKLRLRAVSFLAGQPHWVEAWGTLDAPVALGQQLARQLPQ